MTVARLTTEDDILDPEFRRKVMKVINDPENQNRKREAYRRYEIYKKKIGFHLKKNLQEEGFKADTIKSMMSRSSNIGICQKIVNKKARCYQFGVNRSTQNEELDERIDQITRILQVNEKQKKIDRFSELHMNAAMLIVPVPIKDDESEFTIEWRPLQPWAYDVIEDPNRPEVGKVWILSDYSDLNSELIAATAAESGVHHTRNRITTQTNRHDDVIADNPKDSGEGLPNNPIWWSENYHFTTNENGDQIISESTDNPIKRIPIVNYAIDQDGFFWAEGGDDVIEGTILTNKTITEMFFILGLQGFGIPIISGMNLPRDIEYGPGRPILAEKQNADDPDIKLDYVNPNPPIEGWMKAIEMYVALLLSTNDLSPGSVASTLDAASFQAGIAMMLDKAEAINEIDDKQSMFVGNERESWGITFDWYNAPGFIGKWKEDLNIGPIPVATENLMSIKFNDAKVMETETERLENIKKRKELGLNLMVELIMMDDPDITREEAQQKLEEIKKEKMENVEQMMGDAIKSNENADEDDDATKRGGGKKKVTCRPGPDGDLVNSKGTKQGCRNE